jgi:hypothetical protein
MTPLFVLLALGEPLALAERPAPEPAPFGQKSTATVRGVDPDDNHHHGDGAYGRFDGDLDLGIGAGGIVGLSRREAGVALRGTARWYATAALYGQYAETLSDSPSIERRFGVGLELTPLFLIRWSQALETGPAVLDLAIDSLALGLGATFTTPRGRGFGSHEAFEASLGLGLPLFGTAPGPWIELRGALVFPRALPGESNAMLLFSWHAPVMTPLVRGE